VQSNDTTRVSTGQNSPWRLSSSMVLRMSLASRAGRPIIGLSLATLSWTFWATPRRRDNF
jgi:hypothetical protein